MDGTIEPGDHVHHHPTGEDWVVRYVKGDRMSWLGWPPGEAMLSDCTLIRKADVRVDPPHPARWGLAATPTPPTKEPTP